MKGFRLTRSEAEFLRQIAIETTNLNTINHKAYSLLESILGKLDKAEHDGSVCMIDIAIFQDILRASTNKCASIEGSPAYARATKQARVLGLTDKDQKSIAMVGRWVDVQKWLISVTILDVFSKWSDWLPKARLMDDQNRPRTAGLGVINATTGGTNQPSTGITSRPKAQGFR